MNSETEVWLEYAHENYKSAKVLLESKLFNPCLQNVQQSVEKGLKAIFIEKSIKLEKIHSITGLRNILESNGILIELDDEDCEFLDSIYLPSKYPAIGLLPDFEPNQEICEKGLTIAGSVLEIVKNILK